MADDMFIELDDVEGETTDKDMSKKKAFAIQNWSWGVSNPGDMHSTTGGGTGVANFQDIHFSKSMDKASMTLLQFCSTGKHIKKGKLTQRKAGGDKTVDQQKFIEIEIENIIVSSYQLSGGGGSVSESVSLNFRVFHAAYSPQSTTSGKVEAKKEYKHDIAANESK